MKIKFSIFFIIFFLSVNINAKIPRDSVSNLKQLTWHEIDNRFSETSQYVLMVNNTVNANGSNFYYPAEEKYGKLSENGIGQYKYREPEFGEYSEYTGDDVRWSIDKKNNKICYGGIDDLIDEYGCVYLFEGFENDKKYLYYSSTPIADFYSRINHIEKINNELIFDQWSDVEKIFSKENILNVKIYIADKGGTAVPSDLKQQQADLQQQKIDLAVEEKRIADLRAKSRLSAQNNPGFRDLKPGLHYEDVLKICPLEKDYWGGNSDDWVRCYGINNIKFKAYYTNDLLDILSLDMGPIVEGGFYLDIFGEGDSNIYTKMKKSISDKYTLEYEYSERDRQLFNESEKSSLLHVYSKGQVVLVITRKEKDYSNDLWLYINYRDPYQGEWFLEKYKPVRATSDDF